MRRLLRRMRHRWQRRQHEAGGDEICEFHFESPPENGRVFDRLPPPYGEGYGLWGGKQVQLAKPPQFCADLRALLSDWVAGGVMISGKRYGGVLLLILAAGVSAASGRPTAAQEVAEVA